ncbi:hypothetical protein FHW36_1011056 [Chitinophaga polysaccharea]|uniref:Uncharacterized protein n=1 Tax=Chitinophaga polysaccharea TaxID=1293035 RepID=A0A561Q436_9BACT|nr:hypothetical protein FHW36_1011056 [Chitinophaga polysaccharea]
MKQTNSYPRIFKNLLAEQRQYIKYVTVAEDGIDILHTYA